MASQKFERIALIIIDQLRRDYEPYFVQCRKLLSYCNTCDTNSIPTSTEAMHTNISTGLYPKDHGVISKESKNSRDIESLIQKYLARVLTPLASSGFRRGYKIFFAGGKKVVADVIATDAESDLRVFGMKGEGPKWTVNCNNYEGSYWEEPYKSWNSKQPECIFTPDALDNSLLSLFEALLIADKESNNNFFYILALSGLDKIGHDCGPHSDKVINHIKDIDKTLASLIDLYKNTKFVIAGDHGCRSTDKYIIQQREDSQRFAIIYRREENIYRPVYSFELDLENKFQYVSFDGGELRIWLSDGCSLSPRDTDIFSEYGNILDLRLNLFSNVEPRLFEIIENSRHANIGDIIVVSKEDSTFCKNAWIENAATKKKIIEEKEVQLDEFPKGEHGTYYDADRLTLFMSNHDFGKEKLFNLQIREEIEKLMFSAQKEQRPDH